MEWIEAKINTPSENVEAVCGVLLECGISGVQIEDTEEMKHFLENNKQHWDYVDDELLNRQKENASIIFYVQKDAFGNEAIALVKNTIKQAFAYDVILKDVSDETWLNEWKKYYKPFEVGQNIVIKPVWENYENSYKKVVFNINPGHVFGTGLHQTTQLCIEQLEKHVFKDCLVLDLGCGSGILSIISLLIGAGNAFAVDIDKSAEPIAYENAALNNISKCQYTVTSGDVVSNEALRKLILENSYNIVVANIVADVIVNISEFAAKCLEKGGIFISSGIIKERQEDVYTALKAAQFNSFETFYKDDWVCIVARRWIRWV